MQPDAEYLVIGNSTAAVGAVEGIRLQDPDAPILLLSAERRHTYSRPLISYLLAGEVEEEGMYYRGPDFYERHKVEARPGCEVTRIDDKEKKAVTSGGAEITFNRVLIAVGGKPFVPEIPGRDAEGVFTFTSWDDAEAIDGFMKKAEVKRTVVIGGGLIGIKAAEALHARGVEVLIVELAGRILPLALDEEASGMAERSIYDAGVRLECGTTVENILSEKGRVSGVRLKSGRRVECGMVVVAIGVVPNTDIVKNTDIETGRGIMIDEHCRTSVDGIYAAGDVSQWMDTLSGRPRPIPIFPNACRQGRVAGMNMAGGEAKLSRLFGMNSVEVFGLPTISVGLAAAEGDEFEVLASRNGGGNSYKRLVLRDNRIVGALFAGDIDRAGIITGLIRDGIDVSGVKDLLLTDQFGLISLPAEYRKHVVKGEGIVV